MLTILSIFIYERCIWCYFVFYFFFVGFYPNVLGHPDNFIKADPLVTPAHIVPEWYFLPFYAILRSIPHKLGGVIAMISAIIILALLPWIHSTEVRSSRFRPLYRFFYWTMISCCLLLGWIGGMTVEEPYVLIGQLASIYYFLYFLILLPFFGKLERFLLEF